MFVKTSSKQQSGIRTQKVAHQIIRSTTESKDSVVKDLFHNKTIKRCRKTTYSMKKQPTALTTTVKNVNCLAKTTTIYMKNNCKGGGSQKYERDSYKQQTNTIKTNISTMKNKYSNSVYMLDAIWLIVSLFVSVIVPNTNALMNTKLTATATTTATTATATSTSTAIPTTIILALERNKINSDDECVNRNKCLETTTTTTTLLKTNNDNNNNSLNTEFAISTLSSKTNIILQMDKTSNKSNSDNNDNGNDNNHNDNIIDVDDEAATEYIFDRTDVRFIFITLYTLVFCCCFFGNLLVILVVTMSRRLRSITNFFLANLALADFCVGLFCVMQNLSIYLIDSWVFGEFLCRMYQFVHSLSYTASIFILVVICMERYFAIVHPITCKQILTAARLRMVILTVWITSALYSTPKFIFSKTIKNIHTQDGQEEEICVLDRKMFNSKMLDMINFGLLYVIPLLVMMVLYSKIAIALWRSSHGLSHHLAQQQQQQVQHNHQENSMNLHNSMYHHHHHPHGNQYKFGHTHSFHHQNNSIQQLQQEGNNGIRTTTTTTTTATVPSTSGVISGMGMPTDVGIVPSGSVLLTRKQSSKYEKRSVSISESQVSLDSDRPTVSACRKKSFYHSHQNDNHYHHYAHYQRGVGTTTIGSNNGSGSTHSSRIGGVAAHMSHSSSNNVLRARRGVVRMLIIFVLTFALCNLPYHARKMWQYWSRSYRGDSNFIALLTPLTFLVSYFNSGVNPLLYAFLSRNFRKGMKELLLCSWKKAKGKSSSNAAIHQKRMALQTHSLPTDTTHIGNEQL